MGFRARWTEEQFEEWFHARFDQWVAERFGEQLKTELDQRMPAWADRVDSRFREGLDTQFVARFNDRIRAWQDGELKKGFDAWVENWFDHLFTVWANTWADGPDFRERFDQRFDLLFKEKFEEEIDNVVQARVANQVNDLIDLRIKQWLVSVRQRLLDAAEIPADQTGAAAAETAAAEPSASEPDGRDAPTATAAQLAEYLAKKPVGPQQIRRLLRGKEIPGQRPAAYSLDEAASALLLRKGRRAKAPKQDTDTTEKGEDSAAP